MSNARNLAKVKPNSSGLISSTNIDTASLPAGAVTGTIVPFGGSSVPSDWLLCYGQAVSRTTYASLFTILSTTYGSGDGSSTFNLPDLRGRVPGGKDNMGGAAANRLTTAGSGVDGTTLGASGGAQTHTLSEAQLPSHTHSGSTASAGAHTHSMNVLGPPPGSGAAYYPINDSNFNSVTATDSAGAHTHTVTIGNTGSGSAHNNTQPTLVLNYIIKT